MLLFFFFHHSALRQSSMFVMSITPKSINVEVNMKVIAVGIRQ